MTIEVWGLTGGIAAGKSTVGRLFEARGIPVVDADQIARELSQPGGAGHEAVVKRFGTADRARLREIIFTDAAARRDLEAILHPLIIAESRQRISEAGAAHVLYEATLLVETGRHRDFNGLIVVDAPRADRIARLIKRDGCTQEQALRVLSAQSADETRRAAATVVIENAGTLDELSAKVDAFIASRGWRPLTG